MAHSKATVALDRQKVAAAMALTDQGSMSEVIDLALTRLISSEQTRRDIAAYARQPQDEEKITLARHPVTIDLDDDDVDYVALYGRGWMSRPSTGRGDVWFADVPGDRRRPVLALTRDPFGTIPHSVICAPITSTILDITTEVSLDEEAGLLQPSVANFDNTLLLDRSRLVRRLGRVGPEAMAAACRALSIATGCSGP